MAFQPFGKHLHNQIVIPMLVVSVGVALVATFVGVTRLESLIEAWVGSSAGLVAQSAEAEFHQIAGRLHIDSKAVAESRGMETAVSAHDWAGVQREMLLAKRNVEIDDLILLDDAGVVVAKVGTVRVDIGDAPLPERYARYARIDMSYVTLMRVGGQDGMVSVRRTTYGPDNHRATYTLLAMRRITPAFLQGRFRGASAAIGFVDENGTMRAFHADAVAASSTGPQMTRAEFTEFRKSISVRNSSIADALAHAGTAYFFTIGGRQYGVRALGLTLSNSSLGLAQAVIDPVAVRGHIFVVVSNSVAADAARTTMGLIAFWSVVAVLVLTGLGTIIARQVSSPLTVLSDTARRVADGDFTANVTIAGTNEVAELADNFNAMTGSLRERTDTLTKKVLELATLYEMSRALGSTLDLEVLLDSVLDSALRIFNVDSGYVMLRDKASGSLELRARRGMSATESDDRAVRSSMSEWVVRQGRPLIFNPSQDAPPEEHIDSVTGALAALCVPLISNEGVVGSICVGSLDRSFRFNNDDVRLLSTIANHVTIAIGNIELFTSLQEAYLATVRSLAAAVDAKDPFTRGHSDRVATYSRAIAEKLELSTEQCTALEMAAYLHDIGKIGISETILLKPGRLEDGEMSEMKHHPLIGANILRPVAFPWPIVPVVRHHHEHYDGQGYPAGLKGEEIPLLARVLTAADAYEAMTADRPYRSGRTREQAIDEMHRCEGSHFDPRVVAAFMLALDDLDEKESPLKSRSVEDIQPEEARAIFIAICDGMFAGFRRLGGPRLASNLENAMDAQFVRDGIPFSFRNGHLAADWEKAGTPEAQVVEMRKVVAHLAAGMEATAGRALVDHFYDEAVQALSDRMRFFAAVMDLYTRE